MALIYNQTYTSVFIGSTSVLATVPQVVNGVADENIFSKDCAKVWDETRNRQVDEQYYIPVASDQLFMIQTCILHEDPATYTTPATGWGDWIFCEVFDGDDVSLSANYALFTTRANNVYSANNDKNYQTLEIDPALIGSDIFYFKIRTTSGLELCSEKYIKKDCDIIKIQGQYSDTDCLGLFYGEAEYTQGDVFQYTNHSWLDARIQYTGSNVVRELFSDNFVNPITTSSDVTNVYRVQMLKKIPPFYYQFLSAVLLAGQKIYIDEVEFIGNDFTTENIVTVGNMFFGQFNVETRCEANFNCF